MGMYDTVRAECPNCKKKVEFQSKEGDCVLRDYDLPGTVPVRIAVALDDATRQCTCGASVTIRIGDRPPLAVVNMYVHEEW